MNNLKDDLPFVHLFEAETRDNKTKVVMKIIAAFFAFSLSLGP